MPRITSERSAVSPLSDWQKKDVPKIPVFPNLKPKFRTSNNFSNIWGRLPYRNHLNLAQIYTNSSRAVHLGHLKSCLQKFPCDRTLQMRWRFDKELPAFSMEFLYLYLSRFGNVDAIYQQATNACLVLFNQEHVARQVANKHDLGIPYGRLYTRWWNPPPQDMNQMRAIRHIEKACETRSRFHSLMDEDDRRAACSRKRAGERAMVDGNKYGGPHLTAYLYEGVKRIDKTPSKPKFVTEPPTKRREGVTMITSLDEFHEAIKADMLVVVDFFASWCGPCKVIAPVIEEWAAELEDVAFYKVDVDEVAEACIECDIRAMPTFMLFRNNVLLDTVIGGQRDLLRGKILAAK